MAWPWRLSAFAGPPIHETGEKNQPDLGLTFVNVAKESGLNVKTIYGGEHKNKYLLETTGCGVEFYDYDNDVARWFRSRKVQSPFAKFLGATWLLVFVPADRKSVV